MPPVLEVPAASSSLAGPATLPSSHPAGMSAISPTQQNRRNLLDVTKVHLRSLEFMLHMAHQRYVHQQAKSIFDPAEFCRIDHTPLACGAPLEFRSRKRSTSHSQPIVLRMILGAAPKRRLSVATSAE